MRKLFRPQLTVACLATGILVFAALPALAGTIEDDIQTTENRLTEAKRARLNLIAPRAFEEAETQLERAKERFAKGGKIEDIQSRLGKLNEKLTRCDELQEIGELLLRDSFAARTDAIAAKAPGFATELWEQAEKTIRDAGRRIEDGKQNDAREVASQASAFYRDAELLAIRVDILGSAKAQRERALTLKADELAAATLAAADRDLASAEKILQGDRYMKMQALGLAESAREEFGHAAAIATLTAEIEKDRKGKPEAIVRAYEGQFERLAKILGYEPTFSEGIEPVADQIIAAAKSITEDRGQLVEHVTSLQAEIEKLNNDLAVLQDRDKEFQQKERYDRKLREVRGIFGSDEAQVLLGDNELIIRLYGLSFPVGSSEIRPENFALLTRVQRGLREFPTSGVTIEGHTDAQGDENMNQSLSDQRAEAVRTYLLANMGIDAERLNARGYGESRPIANNELEAGRAKNRRIDIVIHLETPAM